MCRTSLVYHSKIFRPVVKQEHYLYLVKYDLTVDLNFKFGVRIPGLMCEFGRNSLGASYYQCITVIWVIRYDRFLKCIPTELSSSSVLEYRRLCYVLMLYCGELHFIIHPTVDAF